MNFEAEIKESSDRHLATVRTLDITGFVDQLFRVATETGTVACAYDGGKRLRFFVRPTQTRVMGLASRTAQAPAICIVEHEAARSVLRMICARLGVICKDRTVTEFSPYGDKAEVDYEVHDQKRWIVSFTNTSDRQEFLIEAL